MKGVNLTKLRKYWYNEQCEVDKQLEDKSLLDREIASLMESRQEACAMLLKIDKLIANEKRDASK